MEKPIEWVLSVYTDSGNLPATRRRRISLPAVLD